MLTYTPTNQDVDGTWRRISVVSSNPLLKVRTRTVCVNYRREPLPDHMRYSVVDAIERAN